MKLDRRQFLTSASTGLMAGAFSPWMTTHAFAEKIDMDLKQPNELSNGLPLETDLLFPSKPRDPKLLEGVNSRMVADGGSFAFPRLALEGEGARWDKHFYDSNFAFADGRVLKSIGHGATKSPIDEHGQATIFGGGPVTFR